MLDRAAESKASHRNGDLSPACARRVWLPDLGRDCEATRPRGTVAGARRNPQQWSWGLNGYRRLSRCFEGLAATDESMIRLAMIRLMLRRIVNPEWESWRGTMAFQAQA